MMSCELSPIHRCGSTSRSPTPRILDGDELFRRANSKRSRSESSNCCSEDKRKKTGRKLRRSSSAVEANGEHERPKLRRTISERVPDRKLLHVSRRSRQSSRRSRYRVSSDLSIISGASSRTASSQPASITELVAQELGFKEIPGRGAKEARRRRVMWAVTLTSVALLIASVLLVGITLLLSPAVDAVLRKENEEIIRGLSSGNSIPPTEPDVSNDTSLPFSSTGRPS